MNKGKIEMFSPATIMFCIVACFSDLLFLGLIALFIPIIGLVIAMAVLLMHYFLGIIILGFFWGKTHGWMPKVFLLFAWMVPLPLLALGLFFAIISSNKLVAFVIEQVAIQAVAVATAGTGEALEVGAAAEAGAAATEAGAEVAEGAATVAEGAEGGAIAEGGATAETGTAAAEGAEGGESAAEEAEGTGAGKTIAEGGATAETGTAAAEGAEGGESAAEEAMESPEEKNPMERMEEEELETTPEDSKASKWLKKGFDIADRTNTPRDEDDEEEEEEEGRKAAAVPAPQTTEVPLPSIDEIPKPKDKAV